MFKAKGEWVRLRRKELDSKLFSKHHMLKTQWIWEDALNNQAQREEASRTLTASTCPGGRVMQKVASNPG